MDVHFMDFTGFIDKLIVAFVFIVSYFYDGEKTYIFHLIGTILVYTIATIVNMDIYVTASTFTAVLGGANIFEYGHEERFYKVIIFGVLSFYAYNMWKNTPTSFLFPIATGATVAAAYIFILIQLGYNLKPKNKVAQKKIKELTEEKVCVVYENDKDFVGFV